MPEPTKLPFYGKGVYKTKSGHLRYSSPKILRNEYVHRKVIKDLIEKTPFSIRLLLPYPYEVHHMDFSKENNSPFNLLMLDERMHSSLTADGRGRRINGTWGKFRPNWKPLPEWKLFDDNIEEVPF